MVSGLRYQRICTSCEGSENLKLSGFETVHSFSWLERRTIAICTIYVAYPFRCSVVNAVELQLTATGNLHLQAKPVVC